MNQFEYKVSHALKKEKGIWPKPSRQLRQHIQTAIQVPLVKVNWRAAIGIAISCIILAVICTQYDPNPGRGDDYFKPTKVVDLGGVSFQPTKTVNWDE